ncbi:hypothetical protein BDV95DRAFT_488073 [Massariosphaeria phaeospora]|uniref:Uncharacterized protein n=1 Tax=Massariosphaeria phaeospora TaxID=100035 RepID=A0A7C8ID82_9PLEO|nr:hypothetical protein BDV95DRAFT_488073 [Massariosphaeria phaeospora]
MKGGWHPKGNEGGKESWRGDFRGANTAGWMGKGKDPNEAARLEHQSAPLSTLKDPDSFGPPPKRVETDQDAARQRLQHAREAKATDEQEADKPPPGPYRVDTTGLNTASLPKPPAFRPGQGSSSPTTTRLTEPPAPPPRLPPRLPPRQNSHPDEHATSPPPPYSELSQDNTSSQRLLNQGSLNRLGQAGVSVPGFNMGHTAPPSIPPRQGSHSREATSPATETERGAQMSALQSRFANISTSSAGNNAPSKGTSWADKQAALKTASNLRNDPSKVSLAEMKSTASTANNFRERHGEQATSGFRAASGLNQKYGITNRFTGASSPTPPALPQSPTSSTVGRKRAPPPPPPKRRELGTDAGQPPPLPLGSKPKF